MLMKTKTLTKTKCTKSSKSSCCKKSGSKELCKKSLTVIKVKANIGWGNTIYIRGEGANLNWEEGIAMENISDDEWVWTSNHRCKSLTFKLLINDKIWSEGENYAVEKGGNVEVLPHFA